MKHALSLICLILVPPIYGLNILPPSLSCQYEKKLQPLFLDFLFSEDSFPAKHNCILACVNQKIGIQDQLGKIDKPGFDRMLNQIKQLADTKETYERAKIILTACQKKVKDADNRCTTAGAIFRCIQQQHAQLKKKIVGKIIRRNQ